MKLFGRGFAVVGGGYPGASNLDLSQRIAVPWQDVFTVGDPQFNAGGDAARFLAPVQVVFISRALWGISYRGQRASLGHAPGLQDGDAELLLESFDQAPWHVATALGNEPQRRTP